MKISERKALEILQKDFENLFVHAQAALKYATAIHTQALILKDRVGQLIATQEHAPVPTAPPTREGVPNGTSADRAPESENPLTLS